jgi:hypothetical protein
MVVIDSTAILPYLRMYYCLFNIIRVRLSAKFYYSHSLSIYPCRHLHSLALWVYCGLEYGIGLNAYSDNNMWQICEKIWLSDDILC